jgi:hypothetical protein
MNIIHIINTNIFQGPMCFSITWNIIKIWKYWQWFLKNVLLYFVILGISVDETLMNLRKY